MAVITGKEAGERDPKKGYSAGSLNRLVDAKLLKFAKGLQAFASGAENKGLETKKKAAGQDKK